MPKKGNATTRILSNLWKLLQFLFLFNSDAYNTITLPSFGTNIGAMMQYCDSQPQCLAFNTTGSFKYALLPGAKWTQTNDKDSFNGMYVVSDCESFPTPSGSIPAGITRTNWEYYIPSGPLPKNVSSCPPNGAYKQFAAAALPADATFAKCGPSDTFCKDGDSISIYARSKVPQDQCCSRLDFTYYRMSLTVPDVSKVQSAYFLLSLDDGGRLTIYNSAYPNGLHFGYKNIEQKTVPIYFTKFLANGENKIMLTQVDDCCCETHCSANVYINGNYVYAPPPTNPPPVGPNYPSRTRWQYIEMPESSIVPNKAQCPPHGSSAEFDYNSSIPYLYAPWRACGPMEHHCPNGDSIGFKSTTSRFKPDTPCCTQLDFAYYQTFLTITSDTVIHDAHFRVQVDDGGRLTIFNSKYPLGFDFGWQSYMQEPPSDLSFTKYLDTGVNRLVLTLVDDCCCGTLATADIYFNGNLLLATAPAPPNPPPAPTPSTAATTSVPVTPPSSPSSSSSSSIAILAVVVVILIIVIGGLVWYFKFRGQSGGDSASGKYSVVSTSGDADDI